MCCFGLFNSYPRCGGIVQLRITQRSNFIRTHVILTCKTRPTTSSDRKGQGPRIVVFGPVKSKNVTE